MRHFNLPVSPATIHWGYFSKKVSPALTLRSGDRATIETLTHHANDDYERMIEGDPGAESVFQVDARTQGGGAARLGADRGPVHPRLRRRRRRASPDRPGGDREVPSPATCLEVRILDVRPRPACQGLPCRQVLRLQCRGELGLPLSRPDRGAEAARGHHDLRTGYVGRAVRQGGLQLRLDAADRSRRHSCIRPSITPASASIMPRSSKRENILQECQSAGAAAFWHHGPRALGRGFRVVDSAELHRWQHRRLARRQGRARCTIRSRCRARFSRSAIRTPRRATANSAVPPSRPH